MTVLRLWLLVTAAIGSGLAIWAFAPVLLFAGLVVGGLGVLSALMIALARAIEARRVRRDGGDGS